MEITPEALDEVFPNAPLVEVAFEVRFAPLLQAVKDISGFQALIRDDYPNIAEGTRYPFPPTPSTEEGTVDKLWEFTSSVEDRVIKVAINSFVLSWKDYTTFEDFSKEILQRTGDFCKVNSIDKFTRTGLRYINHIKFASDDAHDKLKRYIVLPIDTYGRDINQVFIHRNETRFRVENDLLTVRTAFFERDEKSPTEATCILDFDCYRDKPIALSDLPQTLDKFHHHIQLQFLSQIREEYKNIMRQHKEG